MKTTMVLFCVVVMVLSLGRSSAAKGSSEKDLVNSLLANYDKRVRPTVEGKNSVVNIGQGESSLQITVQMGFSLTKIIDLNENEETVTVQAIPNFRWTDYYLTWKPEDYGNIRYIQIPSRLIWLPDIVLYNSLEENYGDVNVRIDFDGSVIWAPNVIFKSICSINSKNFPFDKQSCKLKFGSWTYDAFKVNITFSSNGNNLDLNNYVADQKWKLIETNAIYTELRYPCCPEPYPDISYYISIQRNPSFFSSVLIVPGLLLSLLILVMFLLPPNKSVKMFLGIGIFGGFLLLLIVLKSSLPSASSYFPSIGYYYLLNMFYVVLAIFLSCFVENMYERGDNTRKVPRLIKKIVIDVGSRILCINLCRKSEQTSGSSCATEAGAGKAPPADGTHDGALHKTEGVEANPALVCDVREIVKTLHSLQKDENDKEKMRKISSEWRALGMVFDRFFFILYVILIIIALIAYYPRSG